MLERAPGGARLRLPAAFLESGGHPELVGEGGLPFRDDEELPDVLDRLVEEIDVRRAAISTPSISDVADRYLALLGVRLSLTSANDPRGREACPQAIPMLFDEL